MRTYNLFLRKRANHRVCAVAEDCTIPTFIDTGEWEFAGQVRESDRRPIGFDPRAAVEGSRFQGSTCSRASVFQELGSCPACAAQNLGPWLCRVRDAFQSGQEKGPGLLRSLSDVRG
jgi:hypothetical protein